MQVLQWELLTSEVLRLWDICTVTPTPPWSGVTAAPSLGAPGTNTEPAAYFGTVTGVPPTPMGLNKEHVIFNAEPCIPRNTAHNCLVHGITTM